MLTTKIDEMVGLIQKKTNRFSDLAAKLSLDEGSVEKLSLILEKADLARALDAHPAGGQVGNAAVPELQPYVGHILLAGEDGDADHVDLAHA